MRQEDDVVFCVFWAFDFADRWERVRWFTFRFFFANAPVVVGVPVKCFAAVELNRCAVMTDEVPWKWPSYKTSKRGKASLTFGNHPDREGKRRSADRSQLGTTRS
jgi:hypothetical protein